METRLDHIVIGARSLEAGADYVREMLGVDIPDGGRHEMMGMHNKVMSLGNGVYLEVIAINPRMPLPRAPRWFGLDDPYINQSLDQGPRLLTWAVNTSDLDQLVGQSTVTLGEIKHAQRDYLKWKVAITEDGRMPGAGFVPLCLQWLVEFHPSEKMQQLGCSLQSLTLFHPQVRWLTESLASIHALDLVALAESKSGEQAHMELVVDSPRGEILISSTLSQ